MYLSLRDLQSIIEGSLSYDLQTLGSDEPGRLLLARTDVYSNDEALRTERLIQIRDQVLDGLDTD